MDGRPKMIFVQSCRAVLNGENHPVGVDPTAAKSCVWKSEVKNRPRKTSSDAVDDLPAVCNPAAIDSALNRLVPHTVVDRRT